jgi:hypothetical protein
MMQVDESLVSKEPIRFIGKPMQMLKVTCELVKKDMDQPFKLLQLNFKFFVFLFKMLEVGYVFLYAKIIIVTALFFIDLYIYACL